VHIIGFTTEKIQSVTFLSKVFCGTENCAHWEVDHKYLKVHEMWCWRRMVKIIWIYRLKNEKGLQVVKEGRYVLHTVKRKNFFGGGGGSNRLGDVRSSFKTML